MERRLLPPHAARALTDATRQTFAAEEARVREGQDVPADWRLSPTCTAFYNPAGMTQAEIDAYDAAERATRRDRDLGLKALRALALAIHKRCKAQIPTDTTTAAQWEAAIKAEWDALT